MKRLLVLVCFVACSLQGWWKEVSYSAFFTLNSPEFTLKNIVAGKDNELWGKAKKKPDNKSCLVKLDYDKKEWIQIGDSPVKKVAASRDGAVFFVTEGMQDEKEVWHLVRLFEGEENIIGSWEKKGGVLDTHKFWIVDLVVKNKENVLCAIIETYSTGVHQREDGSIISHKDFHCRFSKHEWLGSSWKPFVDSARIILEREHPRMFVAKDGSVLGVYGPPTGNPFVEDKSQPEKIGLVAWERDHWENLQAHQGLRQGLEQHYGGTVIDLSAIDGNDIWFILDHGMVVHWNGSRLVFEDRNEKFFQIVALSDELIFVLNKDGKLYQRQKGKDPEKAKREAAREASLWEIIKSWFIRFF